MSMERGEHCVVEEVSDEYEDVGKGEEDEEGEEYSDEDYDTDEWSPVATQASFNNNCGAVFASARPEKEKGSVVGLYLVSALILLFLILYFTYFFVVWVLKTY